MNNKTCLNFLFISALLYTAILAQESKIDFPLQIGNRWQYSEGQSQFSESRVVRDTLMMNNKTYSKIEGLYVNGYYRKEGTKVYSYHESLKIESLVYDFSLNVGDTVNWIVYPGATFLTTVSSKGETTIFGQKRNYMTFFRDDINTTGDGYRRIVDGLGLVLYYGEVMAYECKGAVINGVQYGIILDVEKSDGNIPKDFNLLQNYQNPFNPTTTIAYELNKSGVVEINLYDLLGNCVTNLFTGYKNAGSYKVIFDMKNLASGVYFYTIKFNNNEKTKSMVLLK